MRKTSFGLESQQTLARSLLTLAKDTGKPKALKTCERGRTAAALKLRLTGATVSVQGLKA